MELSKHKRIRNRKVIQEMRKQICERCGKPSYGEPHHVYTVGSGGGDIRENLIQLCADCHIAAHAGHVGKEELIDIVAEREGMTSDNVIKTNRKAMGYEVEL